MMAMKSNRMAPPTTLGGNIAQLLLSLVAVLLLITIEVQPASPPIAVAGCHDKCGNISIPYPFGIGPNPNCFLNHWFRVNCTTNFPFFPNRTPTPILASLVWNDSTFNYTYPVEINSIDTTPISLPSSTNPLLTLSIKGFWSNYEGFLDTEKFDFFRRGIDMRKSPFLLMPLLNTLVVLGCNGTAGLADTNNQILVGCTTVCLKTTGHPQIFNASGIFANSTSCYGINCCQASIPNSLDYFQMEFLGTLGTDDSQVLPLVVSTSYLANNSYSDIWRAPIVLQWKVPELPRNVPNISNARCSNNDMLQGGYICSCKYPYYHGNPYLPQGCQVIEECEQCPYNCVSSNGGETYGCPTINPDLIIPKKSALPLALGLGISLGSISMFVILYGLFRVVKDRKEIRVRQSNFKKNGGLLLQQQMSAREGAFERINVFTCDELERATDKFNENRILGRGGQGTVYKGMLPDGTIVAIKKSKRVDESQLGQFINEVVILSQIKHRNVVKLYGCCLETEVPLLVYEFVLNGTLFEHIHNGREDFCLTWKMRMQIAIESAEALRYIHSSSSTPIYHRDIKTTNILLDDRYRAKVSDFGISKTVSIDQTHMTTRVQGTFGYIDPEYFHTNQFTEKSDVYSFGIVLVELLTSKKPVEICIESSSGCRSLVSDFFQCRRQSRLCDIIDANVLKEAQEAELEGFADLAESCLSLMGSKRPTMNVVATTLQMIKSQNDVPHSSSEQIILGEDQVCLLNEAPFSISAPPASSGDFSKYTQPLLFHTDSSM